MTKIEESFIGKIREARRYLFFAAVCVLGVAVRYAGRDFLSGDMEAFLIPWFDEIRSKGGISGLECQVGDYNLLYQSIIALLTYIDMKSLYLYKLLSCFFDYCLAFCGALLICKIKNANWRKDYLFEIAFCAILFLPTIVLNSSYWGQCDSIYTTFLVWVIYFLMDKKNCFAFIFLGIAFSFKLQTIFLLPLLFYLYFAVKQFSILNFGYTLLVFWASGALGYWEGRHFNEPFSLYLSQTETYPRMYMNLPSFWLLVGNDYNSLKSFAMILTLILLGLGLMFILHQVLDRKVSLGNQKILILAAWTVWTCVMFLPGMHERYMYPVDLILVLLCFIKSKFLVFTIPQILLSVLTYSNYLFIEGNVSLPFGIVGVLLWICFTVSTYCSISENETFADLRIE